MHLAQHHFQAQAGYFEGLTRFLLSHLYFAPYGLTSYEFSAESLLNGTVVLTHARGVMPDGLAFQFPGDAPPAPLEIREQFSPTQESHQVLLAIPDYRPGRANALLDADQRQNGLRYRAASHAVLDETTGQDERPVVLAQKNFRLALETESLDGYVTLPIARVRRDGSGHFVYDPGFIPPCLQVGGSVRIMDLLSRLIEMLESKAEALRLERESSNEAGSERASREIVSFWLSHAVHSALVPLRHHLRLRTTHPEELFRELSRFAGALCTFSLESSPQSLPAYDHENLERVFDALDQHIRTHLDVILPTGCIRFPLDPTDPMFYAGPVADRRCFGPSHWFLGVRSSASRASLAAGVPRLVKLASAKHIVALVQRAYPGLVLEHVPSPPAELSPRLGTQYFAIEKSGPVWDAVVSTGEMGAYVPETIADAQIEVLVVLDS